MNIVCVKWGKKYSAEYVHKLYSMLLRNMPVPFNFYCYTDDNTDLNGLQTIPIESDLERVWPKVELFNLFSEGDTMYFDLDVVILNPLERLCSVKTRTVSVLYAQWKSDYFYPYAEKKFSPTLYNSSIMKWNGKQGKGIYEHFQNQKDRILVRYREGMDRYLFNDPVDVDILPSGIAYSYRLGARYQKDEEAEKLRKDYEVCILNQGEKNDTLLGTWIGDYWK